jgi:hypothetical protein
MQLNNPKKIAEFDQVFNYIVFGDAVGEAKKFATILSEILAKNPELQKNNPSLFAIYNDYLIAAKYVAIFDLEDQEIVQLLVDNFDFVLNHPEYDLERKIAYKIRSINDLEQRDTFKDKIRKALLNCHARLGKVKITVNDLDQEATIANWLKDYYIKVGIEKADSLKINEYLANNNNIKLLSPEERVKLKKVFDFFEKLKVSSVELPMFDESFGAILPDGKVTMAVSGQLEKIDESILKIYREVSAIGADQLTVPQPDSVSSLIQLEASLKNYPPSSLEHKAIKQEISRLKAAELKQAQKSDVKK